MIYVMSDIHGNYPRYRSVLKKIRLKKTDTLYILGDVIDRNPDGLKILKHIMKTENIKMLLGNHEHMLLDAIYYHPYPPQPRWRDRELTVWYNNGGEITHRSWKKMKKETRDEMFEFLVNLPINIEIEVKGTHYLLVHGKPMRKPRNGADSEERAIMDAVWNRYDAGESGPSDKTIIFGHTPTIYYDQSKNEPSIWHGENLIGIDCGCAYLDGRLGCLRLDDMKEYYSVDEESETATTE